MTYRLLLDESVEYEVGLRLENYGHDVEHVDFVPRLGKGTRDTDIGMYSKEENRIILTYDDDFLHRLADEEFRAVLYCPNFSNPVQSLADAVHAISRHYPQSELEGVEFVTSE